MMFFPFGAFSYPTAHPFAKGKIFCVICGFCVPKNSFQ